MSAVLLFALLQAAPVAAAGQPERFSILVEPCSSNRNDAGAGDDVVVCGRPERLPPRLPLPGVRGPPDGPKPSNPDMRAATALNGPGIGTECGAYAEACPGIVNGSAIGALMGGVADAASAVKGAFAKKPDKRGRVAIPLDDAGPGSPLPQ